MGKVAIYTRVSTQDQTTLNQNIRLKEFAEKQGWQYDLFEETESSRKTRPVKQELMNLLRKKHYTSVLVYKLDRWARGSSELILEINELISRNIGFYSYSENLDFSSAAGKLHFTILSAFAEFERDLIRERTLEGLMRARKQGKKLGRPQGSKDGKIRKKSGYLLRYAGKAV